MDKYLKTLIQSFNGKDYKDFLGYVYKTFEKEIDVSKGKHQDKYIKMRKSILSYIFSNEKAIVSELNKKIRK